MKSKVAIIDCNRNGLAAIRSLGRAGVEIVGVDHYWRRAGRFSKYVSSNHLIDPPHKGEERFIEALCKIGRAIGEGEKPFLLPVNDEYVRTLSRNWESLSSFYRPLFETDEKMLDIITNKLNFSAFCKRIGIPQPDRYSEEDVLQDRVTYPIIFKPDERRSLKNISVKVFKVQLCHDANHAKAFLADVKSKGIEVIIQRFIPGGDDELYTGGVAAYQGKMLGCFTGKKVRQFPPMAGQASWAMSLPSVKLVSYCTRIVEELGFTGIAQIEFKQYQDELYVIEMNPRSWSWHGLAQPAGVDLPLLVYNAAQGKEPESLVVNKHNNLFWHFAIEDLIYNVIKNRNIGLFIWIGSHLKASSHAFYDVGDLKPWLIHMFIDYPIRLGQLLIKGK